MVSEWNINVVSGQAVGISGVKAGHAGRPVGQWLWGSTCLVYLSSCEDRVAGVEWGMWIMVGNDFRGVAGHRLV